MDIQKVMMKKSDTKNILKVTPVSLLGMLKKNELKLCLFDTFRQNHLTFIKPGLKATVFFRIKHTSSLSSQVTIITPLVQHGF